MHFQEATGSRLKVSAHFQAAGWCVNAAAIIEIRNDCGWATGLPGCVRGGFPERVVV